MPLPAAITGASSRLLFRRVRDDDPAAPLLALVELGGIYHPCCARLASIHGVLLVCNRPDPPPPPPASWRRRTCLPVARSPPRQVCRGRLCGRAHVASPRPALCAFRHSVGRRAGAHSSRHSESTRGHAPGTLVIAVTWRPSSQTSHPPHGIGLAGLAIVPPLLARRFWHAPPQTMSESIRVLSSVLACPQHDAQVRVAKNFHVRETGHDTPRHTSNRRWRPPHRWSTRWPLLGRGWNAWRAKGARAPADATPGHVACSGAAWCVCVLVTIEVMQATTLAPWSGADHPFAFARCREALPIVIAIPSPSVYPSPLIVCCDLFRTLFPSSTGTLNHMAPRRGFPRKLHVAVTHSCTCWKGAGTGDKGGKKDKAKSKQQQAAKQKEEEQKKQDKANGRGTP